MAFVTIAGLPRTASEVPAALADRLSRASAVLVADAAGPAVATLAAAGFAARPLAELGIHPDSAPDAVAAALSAAGGADTPPAADDVAGAWATSSGGPGGVIVVVDGDLPPLALDKHPGFAELVRIMAVLRDPRAGCPWDLEQTHETLRPNILEEAYEVVEAIDAGDDAELAEELGDVLLQIAFHCQMASEVGTFTVDDVTAGIVAKLVRRHPHIFDDAQAGTAEETLHRWDLLKRAEKPHRASALDGIPKSLPALMAAQKISRRVVAQGFEWEDTEGVYAKLAEELGELRETGRGTPEAAEEIGDLLFTAVNLARRYGIDAEQALRGVNAKFERRWRHMELLAEEAGTPIGGLGADRLEELWQAAKVEERAGGGT